MVKPLGISPQHHPRNLVGTLARNFSIAKHPGKRQPESFAVRPEQDLIWLKLQPFAQ